MLMLRGYVVLSDEYRPLSTEDADGETQASDEESRLLRVSLRHRMPLREQSPSVQSSHQATTT
jgi:hypothetical protein